MTQTNQSQTLDFLYSLLETFPFSPIKYWKREWRGCSCILFILAIDIVSGLKQMTKKFHSLNENYSFTMNTLIDIYSDPLIWDTWQKLAHNWNLILNLIEFSPWSFIYRLHVIIFKKLLQIILYAILKNEHVNWKIFNYFPHVM